MTIVGPSNTDLSGIRIFHRKPKLLDLIAAVPLVVWCAACLVLQWPALMRDISSLGLGKIEFLGMLDFVSRLMRFVFAGVLAALLVVRRTPIRKHGGVLARLIALFGAYGGAAAQVLPVNPALTSWLIGSSLLTIGGTSFAIFSLSWLGRSISIMPESRKLVTTGPYSIIRHPLYFGEQTAIVGIALQSSSVLVAAILTVQMACQLYRMRCEEKVLSESFVEYDAYRKGTSFIIPWLY